MQQLDIFSDTRRHAYAKAKDTATILRGKCIGALTTGNFTADEIAEILEESILSIRPRISELNKAGIIEDTGIRRINDSGNSAKVWRLK